MFVSLPSTVNFHGISAGRKPQAVNTEMLVMAAFKITILLL